jgi:hypothetical protein
MIEYNGGSSREEREQRGRGRRHQDGRWHNDYRVISVDAVFDGLFITSPPMIGFMIVVKEGKGRCYGIEG